MHLALTDSVYACGYAVQAAGMSFDESFGQMLGTIAVCAVWPILLSLMPYKALKKVFPPIVTGVTIFLIGTNLVQTGFKVKHSRPLILEFAGPCLLDHKYGRSRCLLLGMPYQSASIQVPQPFTSKIVGVSRWHPGSMARRLGLARGVQRDRLLSNLQAIH
eukprot:GHUV01030448.1.p1 GENE.GHUV01030448.1~~GHUV01030448.1.p1  ORF type:complete len:161 (-),score=16.84 GHUV01030448.1:137-619(-)